MARNLAEIIPSFFIGPGGERLTPEQIARRREVASSLIGKATDTSPNAGGWTSVIAKGVMGLGHGMNEYRADQAVKANNSAETQDLLDLSSPYLGTPNETVAAAVAPEVEVVDPAVTVVNPEPINMDGNQVYSEFMDTVKTGVNNPYALAAIASTGKAESGFSPTNVNRTWSDPSESGKPGTAGGIMSWRGPRYQALASTGDLSPKGQANFFLNEDPNLIAALNNAQSVEEAQSLMNNAWAFAGHNRPGGESARRLGYAQSYLPSFQGQPQGAPQAIEQIAPIESGFDMGRFGDQINLAEMPASVADVPANLQAQEIAYQPNPQVAAALVGQEPTLPQVSPDVARAVSGAPVEVASNQFVPPAMPDVPAPPPLNPAVERILRDQNSTEGSRRAAQAELTRHMQQQEAYKSAIAERQAQQRAIDTRVGLAGNMGIDPSVAYDDNAWQAAIGDIYNTPTDVREYEYNLKNPGFAEYQQQQKRAGATNINNNMGNSNKFTEESDKFAASRFNDIVLEGSKATQMMSDMDQLLSLGSMIGTGKEAQFMATIGPYAQALGINVEGLGEAQAYKSIVDRIAPQMRPVGAGSSSDTDVKMYLNSLPTIGNTPQGNTIIAQTNRAISQNKMQAAEIAARVQSGEIKWQEGDKLIRELPNPYENFKNFMKDGATTTSTGVKWSVE